MTYRTAQEMDEGADLKLQHAHCSMAKLFASEMANRVADRTVQVFGGRGYMRENVAERFFGSCAWTGSGRHTERSSG